MRTRGHICCMTMNWQCNISYIAILSLWSDRASRNKEHIITIYYAIMRYRALIGRSWSWQLSFVNNGNIWPVTGDSHWRGVCEGELQWDVPRENWHGGWEEGQVLVTIHPVHGVRWFLPTVRAQLCKCEAAYSEAGWYLQRDCQKAATNTGEAKSPHMP